MSVEHRSYFCCCSFAALAPGSLFGLATFSHKLGLYDVQGPIPIVKNVFIPPEAEGTLTIELEDVMPLLQFLAPVCYFYNVILFYFIYGAQVLMLKNIDYSI